MLLVAAAFALLALTTGSSSGLKVGDPAPDFSATTNKGTAVTKSDFAGKKVILWFFPRAGTSG